MLVVGAGVINKLEAVGFPIRRYHSDKAKELRSAALIGWLKGQGIHPTWAAGESPAGNRAELAVQGLKGFVRKLLAVSGLDKIYWPLALQHASTRNWINFNEAVGIPQPVLLPFGVKVHGILLSIGMGVPDGLFLHLLHGMYPRLRTKIGYF